MKKVNKKSGIMRERDGVGGLDARVGRALRSMQLGPCSPQALRTGTQKGEGDASSQPVDGIRVIALAFLRKQKCKPLHTLKICCTTTTAVGEDQGDEGAMLDFAHSLGVLCNLPNNNTL